MARTDNTSGHPGVSFNKNAGKWIAYIVRDDKHKHLGTFADIEDAIAARKKAENEEPTARPPYDAETQAWIDEAETKEEREHRQQKAKYGRHGRKYRKRQKKNYDADPRKVLDRNAKWAAEHPEETAKWKIEWERKFKKEHPEEFRARRQAIDERRKPKTAAYGKKWRKENPGKNAAKQAAYKARKIHRTPSWVDEMALEFFYECCPAGCEVDHVIPLMGRDISGLSLETNLQWLTKEANRRKHARGWKKYIDPDLVW